MCVAPIFSKRKTFHLQSVKNVFFLTAFQTKHTHEKTTQRMEQIHFWEITKRKQNRTSAEMRHKHGHCHQNIKANRNEKKPQRKNQKNNKSVNQRFIFVFLFNVTFCRWFDYDKSKWLCVTPAVTEPIKINGS